MIGTWPILRGLCWAGGTRRGHACHTADALHAYRATRVKALNCTLNLEYSLLKPPPVIHPLNPVQGLFNLSSEHRPTESPTSSEVRTPKFKVCVCSHGSHLVSPLPPQFTAPGNGLSQIPRSLFPELTHYSSLFSHSSIIFFGKLANRKRSELGDLEKRQVFKSSRYNIFMKSASLLLSLGV